LPKILTQRKTTSTQNIINLTCRTYLRHLCYIKTGSGCSK